MCILRRLIKNLLDELVLLINNFFQNMQTGQNWEIHDWTNGLFCIKDKLIHLNFILCQWSFTILARPYVCKSAGTHVDKFYHRLRLIYLRIEVHLFCLHWEMKGHWSRVNLVKREALLKDLHVTSVLSFPDAYQKKVWFKPYIYAKVTNNP